LLRLGRERRKSEDSSKNDESDQTHGHLGAGWLVGSLAERHDAHQHSGGRGHEPS